MWRVMLRAGRDHKHMHARSASPRFMSPGKRGDNDTDTW